MNEELVLHILNTACYGLNLDFSIIPQPPYLYIFFDRSPEAVLNYPAITETIRLAAASAGLPPEYEYLALYSRILGQADPDWEAAVYLYQETVPHAVQEPDVPADQPDQEWQPEPQHLPDAAEELVGESLNALEQPMLAEDSSLAEGAPPDQDNFTVDPTIVFETDPGSSQEPVITAEPGTSDIDPAVLDPIDTIEKTDEMDDDDIDPIGSLPLPPPPPGRLKTTSPVSQATISPEPPEPPEPPADQPKGDDMAQFYFKAKAKPKAVPPSAELPVVAETAEATATAPVVIEEVDLSSYCFIRNKLLLDSAIKPPSKEVMDLIAKLHFFSAVEKEQIAPLLDNLYRQPPKKEESSGESDLYQVGEVDLRELPEPIQAWFQAIIALDPEPFRKSAIWFSRYCHNPQKTIAELSIPVP
jgi:hypothetical protein